MTSKMPSLIVCVGILAASVASSEEIAPQLPSAPASTDFTATPGHLLVRVRMLEINRTKMRKLGVDFAPAGDQADGQKPGELSFNSDTPLGLVQALEKHKLAREIDRADILLKTNGKTAEFFQGGTIEVPQGNGQNKKVRFGTEVKVLAEPVEASNVRVQINFKHSNLDSSRAAQLVGNQVAGFRVKQIDTAFESEIGKTVTLGGMRSKDLPHGDELELLLMVTTEAADDLAAAPKTSVAR
ncbi:hypothetical protein [Aeoliella sp.]|uniref:hypothetical protein n=1 Tax=Aeoliella sp. TaxID=2795800 RepID=UPI003CCC03E1